MNPSVDDNEQLAPSEVADLLAALYDRLLAGTTRFDVLETCRNLQRASQENHLPAFRRCAERGGPGRGQGRGRGGGGGGRGGSGRS